MTDELKPCPFCGGEAERTTLEEDGPNFGGDVITCKRCFSSSHVEFGFKENLNSHWNTRATDATLRAKIKAMHAGLPYFNVPHIREGLEDMLDVIGKIGDENDG